MADFVYHRLRAELRSSFNAFIPARLLMTTILPFEGTFHNGNVR